jgi:hypothetical protein
MADLLKAGCKIRGHGWAGLREPLDRDGNPRLERGQLFLTVDCYGVDVTVFPECLGKLCAYSAFRPRDGTLLAALRSKTIEWSKLNNVAHIDVAAVLPGTVALAMLETTFECQAETVLKRARPMDWWTRPVKQGFWSSLLFQPTAFEDAWYRRTS